MNDDLKFMSIDGAAIGPVSWLGHVETTADGGGIGAINVQGTVNTCSSTARPD